MSKSTMDQKIETFIKKANDDMCRVYLNLSPIGDVCMDYLVNLKKESKKDICV